MMWIQVHCCSLQYYFQLSSLLPQCSLDFLYPLLQSIIFHFHVNYSHCYKSLTLTFYYGLKTSVTGYDGIAISAVMWDQYQHKWVLHVLTQLFHQLPLTLFHEKLTPFLTWNLQSPASSCFLCFIHGWNSVLNYNHFFIHPTSYIVIILTWRNKTNQA